MARRFLTNIDLGKNEIQNVVIHKLATAPTTPVDGQIYYNTSDNIYYLRQPTGWKDITGRLDNILAGSTAILISDNGDGTLTLDVAVATTTQKGLMSAADKTKLDNSTDTNTPNTLVERDANGDFSANRITANDITITNAPVNPTDAVNKQYVDNLVSSGVTIKGSIDCSTSPNYPAAVTGDAYYVSVAGRIGGGSGPIVQVGDLIVALNDNAGGDEATVGSDWMIMERNIDYATETTAGYIRIATQTEADAGTDDTTAITPLKLATILANYSQGNEFGADVGDGVATSFTIQHDLNTTDIVVQVKDNTTLEQVEVDVVHTDANNVTVSFTNAPATNAYRVIIKG
jgi:hypothetical protein